ncbi:MAG: hypothetical protein JJ900_12555 [Rhodospirillales bacterium]|nr:hypothetical protein [Rhodospirillales bacterium]MBO6787675.1 hypothetical protein [Rhodospirillales bacterium]
MFAFWASLFAMLLLMGIRLYYGFSLSEPLQFITSGDEQSSLFAIWKFANGLDVYSDPTRSPYSMSFFNALFYSAYGTWSSFWLYHLALADAWLPSVARIFTLFGTFTGWMIATFLFLAVSRRISAPSTWQNALIAALAAALLFVGPLTGFWAFTVRPDIWAFTFEVLGVFLLVRTYGRNKHLAVVFAAVALFVGWTFKQSAISAVCGVGLFLLFEREWRALFLYCTVYLGLCFTVISVGDDLYRQSLFFSQIELKYSLLHGLKVWANAIVKTLPIYLPLLIVLLSLIRYREFRRRFLTHWICRFFTAGYAASAGVMFLLTLQDGSAENYTLAPNMFAAGVLVCGATCLADGQSLRHVLDRTWVGAAAAHAVLCLLVVTGVTGVLDATRKTHPAWVETAQCINQQSKPVFVESTYLALPWMVDNAEHFVLSFLYHRARTHGVPHEKGGVGGRIDAGEFATLALSTNSRERGYDGSGLDRYQLTATTCGDLHIWSRTDQ